MKLVQCRFGEAIDLGHCLLDLSHAAAQTPSLQPNADQRFSWLRQVLPSPGNLHDR